MTDDDINDWVVISPHDINQFFWDTLCSKKYVIAYILIWLMKLDWRIIMMLRMLLYFRKWKKYKYYVLLALKYIIIK